MHIRQHISILFETTFGKVGSANPEKTSDGMRPRMDHEQEDCVLLKSGQPKPNGIYTRKDAHYS